ncbi:MAG: TrkH family potassium uptake protein [Candidatus Dadabacteria bacterium]|nr:TrkH family potassium uptake protein [Candidatus Dadabacteria bacterium]
MSIRFSLHITGNFMKYLGLLMLVPVIISLIYKENDLWAFIISALITTSFGFILETATKPPERIKEIQRKEGFLIAALFWFTASIFGAIPYLIYGVFNHPVDAWFESVAGFTTTGATVLTDIEVVPYGMLFWRSFSQWLGGMGIIVLGIAILPRLAVGGMQLMGLEAPGPTTEKITPRIAETAKKLWGVYLLLSFLLIVFLLFAGMPIFDSVLQSFSTMSTGGFSPNSLSVGFYNSSIIDVIITIFMFIAGMNFVLLYWSLRGDFKRLTRNSELKYYFFLNLSVILIVSFELWSTIYPNFFEALRYGSFQVISISTGSGFSTANFDLWPSFSKWFLLMLMFFGGCAGSTTGSIKIIRIMVLFKKGYQELSKIIYPHAIVPIRVNAKPISPEIVSSITSFFLIYLFIFLISTLIVMAAEDLPIITAISACAASIGNVGPGLGEVGPAGNYANLSSFTKIVLSFLMLIGRLELFTILVIFTPAFWRR